MRVLICGGRDYKDWNRFVTLLHEFEEEHDDISYIISGGAKGVDTLAEDWSAETGVPITVIEAEWDKYGKKAGYLRNIAMADLNPDCVIAFPGGKGTAMMIKIAEERGIPVYIVE